MRRSSSTRCWPLWSGERSGSYGTGGRHTDINDRNVSVHGLIFFARAAPGLKLHLEPADAILLVGGLQRALAGRAHDPDGLPGRMSQGHQDRGGNQPAAAEASAAVNHHRLSFLEAPGYVFDQRPVLVLLGV